MLNDKGIEMGVQDEWLESILKKSTRAHHERGMRYFAQFTEKTPKQLLAIRKAEAHYETELVRFYKWQIKEKKPSPNSARSNLISVQSFFSYHNCPLNMKRVSIPEITIRLETHKLSLSDIQAMFRYGDSPEVDVVSLSRHTLPD